MSTYRRVVVPVDPSPSAPHPANPGSASPGGAHPAGRSSVASRVRKIVRGFRARAGRSDLMVVAAAMTCYAAFGFVPLLAIGTRVAASVFGRQEVLHTAVGVAQFVPGPLHLNRDMVQFVQSASAARWWTVVIALIPASLYAEGTVRSLQRFSRAPERMSRAVRGRLLTGVLVLLAVGAVLLLVGVLRPLLFDPFGHGVGARLLGIFVSFNILFFASLAVLSLVYRLFASTPIRLGPLLLSAGAASSWLAGQTLGYAYAVRYVSGFANAFGGFAPAATIAAIAFLTYLLHLIVLGGYILALDLHEEPVTSTPQGR